MSANNGNSHHGEAATPRTEAALRWMQGARAQHELLLEVARETARRRRRRQAMVASSSLVLVLAAAIIQASWRTRATSGHQPAIAPTATVSLPQRETLPDGSIVELRPGAVIEHAFTADLRHVRLLRGEAHFQVHRDAARPFVVAAGGVAVRAVGTAFSVQLDPTKVEVLVTEGRVAVGKLEIASAVENTLSEPVFLGAGGRVLIPLADSTITAEISLIPEADLAQRLAWRVPQLEFSRTPLPEVLELMSRHGSGKRRVVVEAPPAELAEMKLSGFLGADNVDGLVRLLEVNFSLRSEENGGIVRLRKKDP